MNFKMKFLTAACAVVCSSGAFAVATPVTCSTTTLAGLVNTCAPEVTFYVAGASAQAGALATLMEVSGATNPVFDTSTTRGKLTLVTTSISGTSGATVAWVGIGKSTNANLAGKRVMVIYNKANGSAAGVLQLLTKKGSAAKEEITIKTISSKELLKGIPGGCSITTLSTSGSLGVGTCSTEIAFGSGWSGEKLVHMALSDVRPSELSPGIINKWDTAKFPAVTTGMQGFGVIVNPLLYTALITKEIAAGRLPSSCSSGELVDTAGVPLATATISAACQPNLTKADYSALITGSVTTADAFLNTTGETKKIALARRVSLSGTQAASNIFFAGQAGYVAKTPTTDGFATLLAAGTTGDVIVTEGAGTGDVITAVSGNSTNYAIGVVSLENYFDPVKVTSKIKGALYVKLDGMSPNFKADGTLDAKARVGMKSGYPFAFAMQALKSADLTAVAKPAHFDIYTAIVTGLQAPANNLAGIAYIGAATDTAAGDVNTSYLRGASNYLPLTKQ